MDFDNRARLDNYLNTEPYIIEHVWEKIEVESMNVIISYIICARVIREIRGEKAKNLVSRQYASV